MSSHSSPTLIENPIPMHLEKVHSSLVKEKIPSKRHSVIQEEEHHSSHNIEEIFDVFTFNLYKKDVLIGVKIPCNKGGHCPFRKSQLDSQTFGMVGPMGLWTHYHLRGDLNWLSSTKEKSTS